MKIISFIICLLFVCGCRSKKELTAEYQQEIKTEVEMHTDTSASYASDIWKLTNVSFDSMELLVEPVVVYADDSTSFVAPRYTLRAKKASKLGIEHEIDSTSSNVQVIQNVISKGKNKSKEKIKDDTTSVAKPGNLNLLFTSIAIIIVVGGLLLIVLKSDIYGSKK